MYRPYFDRTFFLSKSSVGASLKEKKKKKRFSVCEPRPRQLFSLQALPDGRASQQTGATVGWSGPAHPRHRGDRTTIVSAPPRQRGILWGLNKRRWDAALTGEWNIPILYKHYISLALSRNWQLSTALWDEGAQRCVSRVAPDLQNKVLPLRSQMDSHPQRRQQKPREGTEIFVQVNFFKS